MDSEMQKLLTELKTLSSTECASNKEQCHYREDFAAISEKLLEIDRTLTNLVGSGNTVQDKTTARNLPLAIATHRPMTTPRDWVQDQDATLQPNSSGQARLENANNSRVLNKRQSASNASYSGSVAGAGLPKQRRTQDQNINAVNKVTQLNPRVLRSSRSDSAKDHPQAVSVSQNLSNSRYKNAMQNRNNATRQSISYERALIADKNDYLPDEVDQHFEMVTLLPDVSIVESNIECRYMEPKVCFKCTICQKELENDTEFFNHLREEHAKVGDYICACKEKITIEKEFDSVITHFLKHSGDQYECTNCNGIFYIKTGLLDHLTDTNNHANEECTFKHLHREANSKTTITETKITKLMCLTCNEKFDQLENAMIHFSIHSGQVANYKVSVIEKKTHQTDKPSDTRTTFETLQNRYILCQHFHCTRCNFKCMTKEDILAHHNEKHHTLILGLRLGAPMLIDPNTIEYGNINEKFDRFIAFSCYWCYTNNNDNKFISGQIGDVLKHWEINHEVTERHPFYFHVEILVKCIYCDMISTYNGLKKHCENSHEGETFGYLNINEHNNCPMCKFIGNFNEMLEHFRSEHGIVSRANTVNPNRMQDNVIEQLLNIDIYKKTMCNYCDETFAIEEEFNSHHTLKHREKAISVQSFVDHSCVGVMASCCQTVIKSEKFSNHLSRHTFTCIHCKKQIRDVEDLASHNRLYHKTQSMENGCESVNRILKKVFYGSKLLFGNGLVLYKHNVLSTKHDDTEVFEQLMRRKADEYRAKFNSLLESSIHSG